MGSAAADSTGCRHDPGCRRDSRGRGDCDAHAGSDSRAAGSSSRADSGYSSSRAAGHGCQSSHAGGVGQWRCAKRSRTPCECDARGRRYRDARGRRTTRGCAAAIGGDAACDACCAYATSGGAHAAR